MTATRFIVNSGLKEDRWVHMMALSLCFHLAVFSTILFVPQTSIRFPSMDGKVYHVELVGSPSRVRTGTIRSPSVLRSGGKARGTAKRSGTSSILKEKTQRIAIKKKEAVPVVAKRVSPKAIPTNGDKAHSASKLIDRAISKIERKVEEDKIKQPEETMDKPEKAMDRFAEDSKSPFKREKWVGLFGMSAGIGKGIQLYQAEIESTIKNNWSYPVALLNSKKERTPEAVVIVTVRSDGKILKAQFKRKSKNPLFDDSVLKAIEKSDPLPGFPPGYRKSYEEIEINFSLKDLV